MSFTSVDVGFRDSRYPFEGPDFGAADEDEQWFLINARTDSLATSRASDLGLVSVASLDLEEILGRSDTMGPSDGDGPDSIGGEDGDMPDALGDDEDEEEDDDTESEKARQ
jgi:hypothetical protein